jgi:hypothetical protein
MHRAHALLNPFCYFSHIFRWVLVEACYLLYPILPSYYSVIGWSSCRCGIPHPDTASILSLFWWYICSTIPAGMLEHLTFQPTYADTFPLDESVAWLLDKLRHLLAWAVVCISCLSMHFVMKVTNLNFISRLKLSPFNSVIFYLTFPSRGIVWTFVWL